MTPSPIVVCFFTGLDHRRVDPRHAPFLADAMGRYPLVRLRSLPTTELTTTIFTGVYPDRHGSWHVKLKPPESCAPNGTVLDRLPDAVTTAAQGLLQATGMRSDTLSTIPPRRLRRLEPRRYKYGAKGRPIESVLAVGDVMTIFGTLGLGPGRSRYAFNGRLRDLDPRGVASGEYALEFLESRALDVLQHWYLDRPDEIERGYRRCDEFLKTVHHECGRRGLRLVVLSDHGQEGVRGTIDLTAELRRSGVPAREFTYFLEPSMARFWFDTDRARRSLGGALSGIGHVTPLSAGEMRQRYHLGSPSNEYGELFLSPDPGYIFFPHDFHRPLVRYFLGLTRHELRPRLRDPRLRGDHAYLPHHPSELGFLILLDHGQRARRPEGELIDVAPTLLDLIGRPALDHMAGSTVFEAASRG